MPVILVVCTANVCRSPLAAAVIGSSLSPAYGSDLLVLSAGTDALAEIETCPVAVRQLGHDPLPGILADASREGELTEELVRQADLIVTAESAHRGVVAQLDAAARPRSFTLREAALLAAHLEELGDGPRSFGETVARMNALRGAVAYPGSARSGRLSLSRRRSPLELLDGHFAGAKAHADAVHAVSDAAGRLAASLASAVRIPA